MGIWSSLATEDIARSTVGHALREVKRLKVAEALAGAGSSAAQNPPLDHLNALFPNMNKNIEALLEANPVLQTLDERTGRVRSALVAALAAELPREILKKLKKRVFWYLTPNPQSHGRLPWLLDTSTGYLWVCVSKDEGFAISYEKSQGVKRLSAMEAVADHKWQLPQSEHLVNFIRREGNPWSSPNHRHLWNQNAWLIANSDRGIDLNDGAFDRSSSYLIGCNTVFSVDLDKLVQHALHNAWIITPTDELCCADNNIVVQVANSCHNRHDFFPNAELRRVFKGLDHHRARLPMLEDADFTDPNKGLWEFWGLDAAELSKLGLRARNPADDVQQGMVAIDFGTSSTVVAYEEHGVGKLLRIGVSNFWEKEKPSHYENPTVLEFVDLKAFFEVWQRQAQHPAVSWDDVRCSHEALNNFRHNQTKPEVVASILTKIKRWALDDDRGQHARLRITDQSPERVEHQLAALTLRNPVKGQPLQVGAQDPFDPIELYAWFLGLTINWRRRGIFLRYYMSFPVDYPREVKEKILASFRRGLQRSLPATLISQPVFHQFTVEERASEPAAYAAIALQSLNIEPTEEGVAYAVFDFGGGTTDFDFGRYRLPTEAEERTGIEQVFEHFGSGGDKFLGGENLLDHMAYLTFRHNLEICRERKIAFSRPQDAQDFSGSEMFLENTQAAVTNSLMLVAKLRPFWETGQEGSSGTGIEKIDLLDRDGKKVPCEFTIPWSDLKEFLQKRIARGVENFFNTMKKAFGNEVPAEVHVLLAGNASRSHTVLGLFGLLPDDNELAFLKEKKTEFLGKTFPSDCPEFTTHQPLEADPFNVNHPTCKTGVALGLLQLCPGSSTKVVNHAAVQSGGEAPFQHFVGRLRRGKFHAALHQGATYNAWQELGPLGEDRVFKLFYTQSALALAGAMQAGDPALKQKTLEFAGRSAEQQVVARPIKPHEIEVCNASSAEAAQAGQFENLQVLRLG